GVPFAKKGGQIAPRAPRPDHPQHCFNEQPIVLAASTRVRRLAQTMRLHLRPLGVSQNESFHPKLESQKSFPWNPESQQTLMQARPAYEEVLMEEALAAIRRAIRDEEAGEMTFTTPA